jgi:hypothetical protein
LCGAYRDQVVQDWLDAHGYEDDRN